MFWEKKQKSQVNDLMNRNLPKEARDYLSKENASFHKPLNQPSHPRVVSDQESDADPKIKNIEVPAEGEKGSHPDSSFVRFLYFLGYALGPWAVLSLVTWFVLDSKSTTLLLIFGFFIMAVFIFVGFSGGTRGGGSNDQGWGG